MMISGMAFGVSAPGKIILFGEHAVIFGYPAIALSIGLRCFIDVEPVSCAPTSDKLYVTFNDLSNQVIELDRRLINAFVVNPGDFSRCLDHARSTLKKNEMTEREVSSLEKSLAAFIYLMVRSSNAHTSAHGYLRHNSLKVCVRSEIPLNAGLGSSAAFVVAVTTAFLVIDGAVSICSKKKLDSAQLNIIKNLAREAENIFHLKSSGLDPLISTTGGCVCFQNISGELIHEALECPVMRSLRLLIVNTNISRSTSAIVESVIQRRRKETQKYDDILMKIGKITIEAKKQLVNERECSNLLFLPTLIRSNQVLLTELGVSHPKLNVLIQKLNQMGVASKITGAGCGGCIIGYPVPSSCYDADNQFIGVRALNELCDLSLDVMLVDSFTEGVSISIT